jgi:hypothetical protein
MFSIFLYTPRSDFTIRGRYSQSRAHGDRHGHGIQPSRPAAARKKTQDLYGRRRCSYHRCCPAPGRSSPPGNPPQNRAAFQRIFFLSIPKHGIFLTPFLNLQPKVKKPKDAPTLSLDTVQQRLESIGYEPYPIDLEKDILDVTVTREFMSAKYGGNPQATYPTIGKAFVEKTGLEYFMYLSLLHNPYCAQVPGAPGLLFDATCPSDAEESDDEDEESDEDDGEGVDMKEAEVDEKKMDEDEDKKVDLGAEILFARLGSAIWQYQGQYVMAPAPPLTINEWKQQSPKVNPLPFLADLPSHLDQLCRFEAPGQRNSRSEAGDDTSVPTSPCAASLAENPRKPRCELRWKARMTLWE